MAVVDLHLLAVGRRPDADHVALRVELGDRDLERDRVDRVAGEEVLAAALVAYGFADREQVEDRPDVRVERVVTLTGEDLPASGQARDARRGELPVVLAFQRP